METKRKVFWDAALGNNEKLNTLAKHALEEAESELTSLRAFKAACDGQKPVAVVTDVYGMVWYGSGPIAPIVRRNNIKVGTHLYANPDPEAAQLRMRIADLERKLANDIHTCGPDCQRPGCVERRERDPRVAEACAKVCKELVAWQPNGSMQSIGDRCAEHILAGEWKKHMKGGEL